ncbi:universal stress protein [Pantanalinema rosaneae CENA516]|uniref:universal stress protein n=1 Tax=Pantanalinema rosaneae TaxID=1620701 RepID=UPI003D6E57C6
MFSPFQKILVALDRSDMGQQVFERSLALAQTHQARLMLLHVMSPMEGEAPPMIYPRPDGVYPGIYEEAIKTYARQWETHERESRQWLQSLAERATAAGIAVEYTQNHGVPGRTICAIANTWGADLIVLGRRGHSGLSEMLLGSVSNYVLHHAPCSVLTIQGKGSVAEIKATESLTTSSH